jgi:NADH:ubiquinone oxidoreductase subunit 3 (subunit A)
MGLVVALSLFYAPFLLVFNSTQSGFKTEVESGFLPLGSIQRGFSVQFFTILLLFLLFDLELLFLLPLIFTPLRVGLVLLVVGVVGGTLVVEWIFRKVSWGK